MVSRLMHFAKEHLGRDGRSFTVFIAQHAESGGKGPDPGLSERGREQASAFAGSMKRGDIDIFVSGPGRASLETATTMQTAIGGDLIVLDQFGDPAATQADGYVHSPADRFLRGLEIIRDRYAPSHRVMVVTDGERTLATLRSMRSDAQIEAAAPGTIDEGIPSCALTTFVWRDGAWDVETIAAVTVPGI